MKGFFASLILLTSTASLVWGQEPTDVVSNTDNIFNQNNSTTTSCSLLGLLPFDYPVRGKTVPYKSYQLPQLGGNDTEAPPYAVTHAAAALLAVDHFNARDNSLVPALTEYTSDCSLNIDDLVIENTNNKEGVVPRILMDYVFEKGKTPCAVLGGYADGPTREAAVVANGMKTVTITHGSEDPRLGGGVNPDTTQMCSNQHPTGEAIVNWLRSNGRTDFLTVINGSQEYAITFGDAINNAAVESGFQSVEQKRVGPPYDGPDPNSSFLLTLKEVQKSTWRTIVVVLTRYNLPPYPTLGALADAAEELGMNGDDYVWVFVLPDHQTLGEFVDHSASNTNTSKLVQGSAVVRSLDEATLAESAFQRVWKQQDKSFVERLNKMLPKKYSALPENYFQQYLPEAGAGYMYDSVMVAAMGKCQQMKAEAAEATVEAGDVGSGGNRNEVDRRSRRLRRQRKEDGRPTKRKLQKNGATIELSPHMKGITSLDFTGVTGRINYEDGNPRRPRNRNRNFLTWGVYNIRDIDAERKEQMELQFSQNFSLWYYLTDILIDGPVDGQWITAEDGPFIFSDGTPSAPTPLRDNPNIYLSSSVRIVGLTLMSVSLLLSAIVALLVYLYRDQQIIKRNQPFFLYVLLMGTFVMAWSMLFLSFDELAFGASEEDQQEPRFLDDACAVFPWFISLGYILIYGSLFMKLWRINRLLQGVRTKVDVKQVAWPFIALVGITVIILSVWTSTDRWQWERVLVDENEPQGETIGQCTSENDTAYTAALTGVMVVTTMLAGFMAYKTKDVDSRFSESSWIFTTIVLQFQVLVVGIPILIIVRQQSPDAFYLTCVLLISTLTMSTLVLMFAPKLIPILMPNFAQRWSQPTLRSTLASGGVHVSNRNGNHTSSYSDRTKSHTEKTKSIRLKFTGTSGAAHDNSTSTIDDSARSQGVVIPGKSNASLILPPNRASSSERSVSGRTTTGRTERTATGRTTSGRTARSTSPSSELVRNYLPSSQAEIDPSELSSDVDGGLQA